MGSPIYDIITQLDIHGSHAEISRKTGIAASSITDIRLGKRAQAGDRYCLSTRKNDLIFKLKNVQSGEIYECLKPASLFIHLKIPFDVKLSGRIHDIKSGRQDYATIGLFLISSLCPKRPVPSWTKHRHIVANEIAEARLRRKITDCLAQRIRAAVKTKGNIKSDHTQNLIGCTTSFFMGFIEAKFLDGMSWENHGVHGWHIDHIIPCNTFDLTLLEEQKKCFHYTNLRPLWAIDNLERPKDGSDISEDERGAILSSQNLCP